MYFCLPVALSFSPFFALWLAPLLPFLSLSPSSDSNKAGKLWGCITDLLEMTIVSAILPCLPSLLSVRHPSSPERPVPKLTFLIYLFISLSFMAVNNAIAFFLSFFIYHLKTFLPPFLQFNGSCIHGWTENVPLLKLGPNYYTRNVFLSLYVSLSICVK